MEKQQRLGFGGRGSVLMIYQILAYAGYTAFILDLVTDVI